MTGRVVQVLFQWLTSHTHTHNRCRPDLRRDRVVQVLFQWLTSHPDYEEAHTHTHTHNHNHKHNHNHNHNHTHTHTHRHDAAPPHTRPLLRARRCSTPSTLASPRPSSPAYGR